MKIKKAIFSVALSVLTLLTVCFAANAIKKEDGFLGVYDGSFIACAEGAESSSASSTLLGEPKYMTSVSKDYLLMVTPVLADVDTLDQVGYFVKAGTAEEERKSSNKYYENVSLKTKSGDTKKYSISDIFGSTQAESINGLVVEEVAFTPTQEYTFTPFATENGETTPTRSSSYKREVRSETALTGWNHWALPAFLKEGGSKNTKNYSVDKDAFAKDVDGNDLKDYKDGFGANAEFINNVNKDKGNAVRFYFKIDDSKNVGKAQLAFSGGTHRGMDPGWGDFKVFVTTADDNEKPDVENQKQISFEKGTSYFNNNWTNVEYVVATIDVVFGWNVITFETTLVCDLNFYGAKLYM